VLTPDRGERDLLHRMIFEELCLGQLLQHSREHCQGIMRSLVAHGAQAIILGCTELSALIGAADAAVTLFDTTGIHARKAAQWALAQD